MVYLTIYLFNTNKVIHAVNRELTFKCIVDIPVLLYACWRFSTTGTSLQVNSTYSGSYSFISSFRNISSVNGSL